MRINRSIISNFNPDADVTFGDGVTVTSLAGTGSRMVIADSVGLLSTQAIPSGTVTGTGTTNYITKWTSSTAIGNSLIQDNGTNAYIQQEGSYFGVDAQANTRLGFVKKSGLQPFLAFASDPFLLRVSDTTSISAAANYTTVLNIAITGAATFSSSGQFGGTLSSQVSNGGSDGGILFVKNSAAATLNSTAVLAFATDAGGSVTNNPRIQAILKNTGNGASDLEFFVHSGAGVINKAFTLFSNSSATFSSSVTVNNSSTWANIDIKGSSATQGGQVEFYGATTRYAIITGEYESATNGRLIFRTLNAGSLSAAALTIVGSGAATFSSSVTAQNMYSISDNSEQIVIKTATDNNKQLIFGRTSTDARIIAVTQGTGYVPLLLQPNGGNVIIGTTIDSGERLQVNGDIYANGDIRSQGIFRDYQGEALLQTNTSAVTQLGSAGASTPRTLAFLAGNTERMRITSGGNVGIVTISPGSTLQINGNAAIGYNASTAAPNNGLMVSGNVSIGATLSAWSSSKVLQVGVASINEVATVISNYTVNAYDNAGWKYIASNYASRFSHDNGDFNWYTAAAGTAGAAVSWTKVFSVDADGDAIVKGTLGINNVNDSVKGTTYTPTISNTVNITSSSVSLSRYTRVGNMVTVSGQFVVNSPNNNAIFSFNLSLPVGSAFANTYECSGMFVSEGIAGNYPHAGFIKADVANDKAYFETIPLSQNVDRTYHFMFTYTII